jgi:hypothetical protein
MRKDTTLKTKLKLCTQRFGQSFYPFLTGQKFQYRRDQKTLICFHPYPILKPPEVKRVSDFQSETSAKEPEFFMQSELSDLVRELGLSKDLAEILESSLCEKIWSALGRRTIGTDIEKRNSFLIFLKKVLPYIGATFPSWCTGLDSPI